MATSLHKTTITGMILGATIGLAGVANADEVRLTGSTLGRFNAQSYAASNSILDLTYSNSTFDIATVGGTLDLGGDPIPGSNINNLGSLSLGLGNATYDGNTFDVEVTFTSPWTIQGGNPAFFTSTLSGTISNHEGGIFVDFDNTPQTFTFSNPDATGWFTMTVNDVSIAHGQDASISAHVTGFQSAVPEPSVIATLGLGAIGLLRRRRKV